MARPQLLAVLILTVGARGVDAAAPELARFDDLAAVARETDDPIVGLAAVLEMGEYQDWLPADQALEAYRAIAADAPASDVGDLAAYRALRVAFAAGPDDVAAELESAFGFLDAWSVIGPFPNDGMSGLAASFAPETRGVFDDPVDGKSGPVTWRAFDRVSETGYMAVSDLARPAHSAVAYAACEFDVRRPTRATLDLAVDGAYRAWLNGQPVASQGDHLGGFFSRDRVAVELARGTNTLVVKMATSADAPMGLHARLLGADGRPVYVSTRPATALPELRGTDDWPGPETAAVRLGRLVDGTADPERLAAAAYVIRQLQPSDPAQPWRALAERALTGAPSARALRRLAAVQDESWRADELLERAARTGEPLAVLDLARARRLQMGHRSAEQAADALRGLLELPEPPWGARLEMARVLDQLGFPRAALDATVALAEDSHWAPASLMTLVASARSANRGDLVLPTYERALASDRTLAGLYDDVAALLRVAGRGDEVEPLVQRLEALLPLSPEVARQVAWIARGANDLAGAVGAMDRAIELCPGDADLWATRGRFRLEAGDREGAADDLTSALALRPQDTALRDELAIIAPSEDGFFASYRLGVDDIVALRRAGQGAADVAYTTLVDQKVTRVFDNGLATAWVQQAFDVHTRSGADELRSLAIGYTPDAEVVEVLGVRVIKPSGAVLEVYDTRDFGAGSGPSSIYYDVHTRALYFPNLEPGDLLVYEYTIADVAYRNLFDDYFGDLWFVRDAAPKRLARYVLHVPPGRSVVTNAPAIGAWTRERQPDGAELLRYEASDLAAVPRESSAPGPSEVAEYISVSTYSDWDTLANWYWHLIEDQLVPGPEIVAQVEQLVSGLDDRRAIVAAIYGYVVRNTRYVGLEFGIHGYKPYRTTDCFHRRFGDCKDTASLMKVMLEIAGVDARIALVRTRDLGRIDGYPPSLALFNHAITYVPEFDLFLDGTAGFSGSSELPALDQGASTLVVDDGRGGTFTEIPVHPADASVTRTEFDIDLTGSAPAGRARMTLTGAFAPPVRVAYENAQSRRERLEAEVSRQVAGIRVTEAAFDGTEDIERPVEITLSFEGGDWARRQGDAWVVPPVGPWSDFTSRLSGASTRTLPVDLRHTQSYEAHYRYRVPVDWRLAEPLSDVAIATPFGTFSLTTSFVDGVLEGHMALSLDRLRVAPDEYAALRAFLQSVDAALDRTARFVGGAQ